MIKSFKNTEFYNNTELSFKIDYYSPLVLSNQAERISKLLNKNIAYNNNQPIVRELGDTYIKMYRNYSGGRNMYRIETHKYKYTEAINILNKLMGFIREKGRTNDKCALVVDLFINSDNIPKYVPFGRLNKLKFVLSLDENIFFKYWKRGKRMTNKYLTDFIVPKDLFFNFDMRIITPDQFEITSSKYFGLDFSKLSDGKLTMNYIGGANYEDGVGNIVDGISYLIDTVESTLKNPNTYSATELSILKKSLAKHQSAILSIKTYDKFKQKFPAIRLFVDLQDDLRKIKFNYGKFRDILFKLIIHGNLQRGLVNLDTTNDKFQMKESNKLHIINISDIEIFDCIVSGDFVNCFFENCKIRNSKVIKSKINNKCKISNSKIYSCAVNGDNNTISNSYIEDCGIIHAEIRTSVLKNTKLPFQAKVDAHTIILD